MWYGTCMLLGLQIKISLLCLLCTCWYVPSIARIMYGILYLAKIRILFLKAQATGVSALQGLMPTMVDPVLAFNITYIDCSVTMPNLSYKRVRPFGPDSLFGL